MRSRGKKDQQVALPASSWAPSGGPRGQSWALLGPSFGALGPLSAVAEAVLGGSRRWHGPCRTLRNHKEANILDARNGYGKN
eukprot:1272077-Pyramimonas_sp.AAC.1